MRFTIKTYNGHGFRNALFNDRPLIFSQDLIFFIFRVHQKNWLPLGYTTYTIHPLSPFTHKVREAIYLLLKNTEADYNMKYEEVVASSDDKLIKFVDHIRLVFDNCYLQSSVSINDTFDATLYVARLSFTFFEKDVRDAPFLASEMITDFLDKLPPSIYAFINWHAENILLAKSRTDRNVPSQ